MGPWSYSQAPHLQRLLDRPTHHCTCNSLNRPGSRAPDDEVDPLRVPPSVAVAGSARSHRALSMYWKQRYRLRSYLRSSLWIVPVFAGMAERVFRALIEVRHIRAGGGLIWELTEPRRSPAPSSRSPYLLL